MPEPFDERGEPVGTMPVPEPPQEQPQPASGGYGYPSGAPFIAPSLRGRTDVIPTPEGGLGVPTGGSTAGPNPQDQRNINTYMEQMAKAGLMDKAQKDVDQAMRFLGMRGVEKDVQNGTPYPQALAKHLPYISWNNPAQAEAYSRVIQQSQPLSMQNLDGVRVLRTPRGDRIVPQSAIPQPPVTSAQSIPFTNPQTGEPIEGHFAVPSAGGKGFTVHRKAGEVPEMTHSQRRLELNDAIKFKGAQIDRLIRPPTKDKEAFAQWKSKVDKLNAEIDELEQQRPNATKKKEGASATAVPPKDKRKIGQVYQTPKGQHRWTADGWEPAS